MKRLIFLLTVLLAGQAFGQAGTADRYTSASGINVNMAVSVNASGYAVPADSLTYPNFVGVAMNTASGLELVTVRSQGSWTNSSWSFTIGNPVYLGRAGNLQDDVRIGTPVGMAVDAHTVLLGHTTASRNAIMTPDTIFAAGSVQFSAADSTVKYISGLLSTDFVFITTVGAGGAKADSALGFDYLCTTDTLRLYATKPATKTLRYLIVRPQ